MPSEPFEMLPPGDPERYGDPISKNKNDRARRWQRPGTFLGDRRPRERTFLTGDMIPNMPPTKVDRLAKGIKWVKTLYPRALDSWLQPKVDRAEETKKARLDGKPEISVLQHLRLKGVEDEVVLDAPDADASALNMGTLRHIKGRRGVPEFIWNSWVAKRLRKGMATAGQLMLASFYTSVGWAHELIVNFLWEGLYKFALKELLWGHMIKGLFKWGGKRDWRSLDEITAHEVRRERIERGADTTKAIEAYRSLINSDMDLRRKLLNSLFADEPGADGPEAPEIAPDGGPSTPSASPAGPAGPSAPSGPGFGPTMPPPASPVGPAGPVGGPTPPHASAPTPLPPIIPGPGIDPITPDTGSMPPATGAPMHSPLPGDLPPSDSLRETPRVRPVTATQSTDARPIDVRPIDVRPTDAAVRSDAAVSAEATVQHPQLEHERVVAEPPAAKATVEPTLIVSSIANKVPHPRTSAASERVPESKTSPDFGKVPQPRLAPAGERSEPRRPAVTKNPATEKPVESSRAPAPTKSVEPPQAEVSQKSVDAPTPVGTEKASESAPRVRPEARTNDKAVDTAVASPKVSEREAPRRAQKEQPHRSADQPVVRREPVSRPAQSVPSPAADVPRRAEAPVKPAADDRRVVTQQLSPKVVAPQPRNTAAPAPPKVPVASTHEVPTSPVSKPYVNTHSTPKQISIASSDAGWVRDDSSAHPVKRVSTPARDTSRPRGAEPADVVSKTSPERDAEKLAQKIARKAEPDGLRKPGQRHVAEERQWNLPNAPEAKKNEEPRVAQVKTALHVAHEERLAKAVGDETDKESSAVESKSNHVSLEDERKKRAALQAVAVGPPAAAPSKSEHAKVPVERRPPSGDFGL